MLALRPSSSVFKRVPALVARFSIEKPTKHVGLEEFLTPAPPPPIHRTHSEDAPPKSRGGYANPTPTQAKKQKKKKDAIARQDGPVYGLHCKSTRNNTIVVVTRPEGGVVQWFSGGSCKFKGANRASYEAGYQCAKRSFDAVKEILKHESNIALDLYFKGFGQGREAMRTAMLATEGDLVRPLVRTITDRTPIKIGGTRSKKARRL